jgi:hypothetical protein
MALPHEFDPLHFVTHLKFVSLFNYTPQPLKWLEEITVFRHVPSPYSLYLANVKFLSAAADFSSQNCTP